MLLVRCALWRTPRSRIRGTSLPTDFCGRDAWPHAFHLSWYGHMASCVRRLFWQDRLPGRPTHWPGLNCALRSLGPMERLYLQEFVCSASRPPGPGLGCSSSGGWLSEKGSCPDISHSIPTHRLHECHSGRLRASSFPQYAPGICRALHSQGALSNPGAQKARKVL